MDVIFLVVDIRLRVFFSCWDRDSQDDFFAICLNNKKLQSGVIIVVDYEIALWMGF